MTRNSLRREPASPSQAARRKAALRARSGMERRKPEPGFEAVGYPIGKGRKALKGIAIYMHPLAKDVLDKIAREQGRTVQDLGIEALNLLFRHYGEKPIA
ncbi:MAG: ribbon-helix-helix domain-containing protein [Hyphomicrobiaceae bacterium]